MFEMCKLIYGSVYGSKVTTNNGARSFVFENAFIYEYKANVGFTRE